MSVKETRKKTGSTYGVTMNLQDTAKTSKAGMGFDTNGQPFINDVSENKVQEWPTLSSPSGSKVYGPMVIKMPIAGGAFTGVFASMANPFGYAVLIQDATLDITTQSTGACTLDIGVGANATTSNDGLIDGLSAAAAGLFTNAEDPGTNGEQTMIWGTTQFLNVAEASGDCTGLVANLYVTVVRR